MNIQLFTVNNNITTLLELLSIYEDDTCNNNMALQLYDVECLRYLFQKMCHYTVHMESSGIHMCGSVVCTVENVSHVIHRYYNIPLVSLIKNAKILKFTSCEIEHNYCE